MQSRQAMPPAGASIPPMQRKSGGVIVGAFLALAWTSLAAVEVERRPCESLSPDIPGLVCIDDHHAIAAQPRESAYAAIAKAGFRSVVNLRTKNEDAPLLEEEKRLTETGLRYYWLPVRSDAPAEADAARFLSLLRDPDNLPVLIHCGTANRAAAFWLIHRVVDERWNIADALREAESFGLKNPKTRAFAERYARENAPNRNSSEEKK